MYWCHQDIKPNEEEFMNTLDSVTVYLCIKELKEHITKI